MHASLWPRPDAGDARHTVTDAALSADAVRSRRRFLAPLALAQFICSFAGSNMNVMIADITKDLDTTVAGVQAAITLFLLVMAVLMIPCSKLTDRWGRKRCFTMGLVMMLERIGKVALQIETQAEVTLEDTDDGYVIPAVHLKTRASVPDLDEGAFADAATQARIHCPVSRLIRAEITLDARLLASDPVNVL